MKLKGQKKLGLMLFLLGSFLFIVGILSAHQHKINWLTSFGITIFVIGLLYFLRASRLGRDPLKASDYEASLQDERAAYVADKARSLTLAIFVCLQFAVMVASDLFFDQPLISNMFAFLICAQLLIFSCCFWYYSRKY